MMPKQYSRKKYFVNAGLQLSYSWLLIVCVGLIILIFGMSLWYVNKIHLDIFHKIVGEDALPKAYIKSIENQFLIITPVAILVVSSLLFALGVYSSHRIAGPMYRITRSLNMVSSDSHVDAIQVRKRDQLKEMADAFNQMVQALKDRMYQDVRLIDNVKSKITQLHDSIKGESLDIKRLSEQVREIEKLATELKERRKI